MAGSGWLSFHCSGTQVRFYYNISVSCRPFSVRFISSANVLSRQRLTCGPCVPSSLRPFLCHTSRVCPIFSSLQFVGLVPVILFVVMKFRGLFCLRGLHIGSSRSGSSIIRKQIIHLQGSVPPTALRIWFHFWFFFFGRR